MIERGELTDGTRRDNDAPKLAEVAVGLIVADDGRILLQHRDDAPGIINPGGWGFFGGHIEPGERPAEAFLRELDEEVGWRPRHFEPYLTREVHGDGWRVMSHAFAAHLDVPLEGLTLLEGAGMGLFAPDALPEGIVQTSAPVIEAFAVSDAYRRVKRAWDVITTTGLIVDARGRFLLQHRDDRPDIFNPGLWGSFGGRVEPYEAPDDGFLRELREELEWRPTSYELYAAGPYRTIAEDDPRTQLIYVYAAALDALVERLVLHEGQALAAFAPDALPEKTVPALRSLIGRFTATAMYRDTIARAAA